ncbi:MAG: DUF2470 domain-containing protein [Actinomycetota bacterium]
MTRPAQHGGGEAAPPIAGDPSSFPNDAELSRTLIAMNRMASLSTLTEQGYPYGSVVSYAADDQGQPVVLISEMAEHTVNARGDTRASMLIVDTTGDGDPLGNARLTLVGRLNVLDNPGELRDRYLEAHPYASYYADFTDFNFWRLDVEQCRYVGGFGHMSWVSDDGFFDATVDPLAEVAAGVVEHMNDDHRDANLLYAQVLAELDDATDSTMTGIDRYGVTLRVDTPAGPRMARVPFPAPLTEADQARPAVIELLQAARSNEASTGGV